MELSDRKRRWTRNAVVAQKELDEKRKRKERLIEQDKRLERGFLEKKKVIGRNDLMVNQTLGKIKIEEDFHGEVKPDVFGETGVVIRNQGSCVSKALDVTVEVEEGKNEVEVKEEVDYLLEEPSDPTEDSVNLNCELDPIYPDPVPCSSKTMKEKFLHASFQMAEKKTNASIPSKASCFSKSNNNTKCVDKRVNRTVPNLNFAKKKKTVKTLEEPSKNTENAMTKSVATLITEIDNDMGNEIMRIKTKQSEHSLTDSVFYCVSNFNLLLVII